MIEETARVVALDGEHAWVEAQRQSTCGGCSAAGGCGTQTLGKVLGRGQMRLRARNTAKAAVGEQVLLGIREEALLKGSLVVYLLPLAAMIGLAVLGEALASQLGYSSTDLWSAAAGMAGLAGGFVWVGRFGRGARNDERYQAVVLRRLTHSAAVQFDITRKSDE